MKITYYVQGKLDVRRTAMNRVQRFGERLLERI